MINKNKLIYQEYQCLDLVKPEDIANLVYFLSTDDSSYITGQNFHVNGGMLMV